MLQHRFVKGEWLHLAFPFAQRREYSSAPYLCWSASDFSSSSLCDPRRQPSHAYFCLGERRAMRIPSAEASGAALELSIGIISLHVLGVIVGPLCLREPLWFVSSSFSPCLFFCGSEDTPVGAHGDAKNSCRQCVAMAESGNAIERARATQRTRFVLVGILGETST